MIKLIIFDLDGVLVESRDLHYESLNRALKDFELDPITRDEHLSTYDGRPTSVKLDMLTAAKGVPKGLHDAIWRSKQEHVRDIISKEYTIDPCVCGILSSLKGMGYTLCCSSNSIRESTKMMLLRKGFMEYMDFYYSNQDVMNPKPNPEMHMRCMIKAGVSPTETLIVEDSHIGRKAAIDSGAHLCGVINSQDLCLAKVIAALDKANGKGSSNPKWQGGNLNVLIPLAGKGSRFAKAGYTFPKPLIAVRGKPMIQAVVENLNIDAHHIFIVLEEHYHRYNMKYLLNLIAPGCSIILSDGNSQGAAWDCLRAREEIDTTAPLLLANSDQWIDWNSNQFMYAMSADAIDGGILTFKSVHPKWSFAHIDANSGYIDEVAEKKPISDNATVGIYYWKHGSDFVKYADQMIAQDLRVNGEFYVCPVFNEAIDDGKLIRAYEVSEMWGLGTPEDLNAFLEEKK